MAARKYLTALAAIFLSVSAANCDRATHSTPPPGRWQMGTTVHDLSAGDERSFLIHVPALRPRTKLLRANGFPLVIVLHGSGADGGTIRYQTNFDSLSEIYHVAVAYPDGSTGIFGIGSDWNAGECCGAAARQDVDDVGFIRGVIAEAKRHLPIDPHRVYVAGFSDGGRMAYHFACAAAPEVAAIGVVSGSLVDSHCKPVRPVPAAIIHGTGDNDVPYTEAALTAPPYRVPSELVALPPSAQFWAVANGCSGASSAVIAPTVTRTTFRKCTGADVAFYTIEGGTHSWPGGKKDGSDGQMPNQNLDASGTLMRFFLAHSR
jgi:Poly(3-hydroxybutyrate) depolymerase